MRKGALNKRLDTYLLLLSTVVNRLSLADANDSPNYQSGKCH